MWFGWMDEFTLYMEWVRSLKPLTVAGPLPPWRAEFVPRADQERRGHPNPHRGRQA